MLMKDIANIAAFGVTAKQAREIRERSGLTVTAMAEKMNVTRQAIHNWETGKRPVNGSSARLYELYVRSIAIADVMRTHARAMSKAVAAVMGEQRAGDYIGTLLVGALSLTSNERVTVEQASEWVGKQDWNDQKDEVAGMSDERALLDYIMQQRERVMIEDRRQDRTIGELVMISRGMAFGPSDAAQQVLARIGIKVDPGKPGAIISNTADGLKRMLRNTPWGANWAKVLKRLPNAEARGATYFGFPGSEARAVWVDI
jgi:transcriptional regulator with XRE-family HTH domain